MEIEKIGYTNGLFTSQELSYEREVSSESWWEGTVDLIFGQIESEYKDLISQTQFQTPERRLDLIREENSLQIKRILTFLGIPSDSEQENFREGSFLAEAVELSSTRRLFGLAFNPVVNRLLGLNLNRGRHTIDCMRLTAQILTQEAVLNPDLFDQLAQGYQVKVDSNEFPQIKDPKVARRIKIIQHLVEYMRRHDEMTLAFQGAMHRIIKFKTGFYDENIALLWALSQEEDPEVGTFYEKHDIRRELIRQIAYEANNGSTSLSQILKGKRDGEQTLGIDFISYTSLDTSELARVFGRKGQLSFLEKLETAFEGMINLSLVLKNGGSIEIRSRLLSPISPQEFVLPEMIRLAPYKDQVTFVFTDPIRVYRVCLAHILLRLFFSGSPLVQGTEYLVFKHYQPNVNGSKESRDLLIAHLLGTTEEKLIREELATVLPIFNLNLQEVINPDLLPSPIKGWFYSSVPHQDYPEVLPSFKDVSATLIKMPSGKIVSFTQAFPQLSALIHRLQKQIRTSPLYLTRIDF